jgi:GNAT superfamily N-acetyltransferase
MLWRVRTSLTDRPGSLAQLAVICGEHGLNILAVQIFPEIGSVVDELVVEAADVWTGQDLAALVATSGGSAVSVSPCASRDLVDEPVRWLRAAERMIQSPDDRGRILAELTSTDPAGASYSENARISALLDVVGLARSLDLPQGDTDAVVYEVLEDAVIARSGESVIATASLDEDGTTTVVVSRPWRRKGVGRAVFVLVAGVARHAGHDEIVLVAPADGSTNSGADSGATLAMLNALGLRGLVRLEGGVLRIRVSLADIRPVTPRSASRGAPALPSAS